MAYCDECLYPECRLQCKENDYDCEKCYEQKGCEKCLYYDRTKNECIAHSY